MGLLTYLSSIVFAIAAVIIYSKVDILLIFVTNAPSRLQPVNTFQSHEVLYPNVVRNCEDMLFDAEGGFLILSCDPGRDTWNSVMGTFVNASAPADTGLYFFNHAASLVTRPEKLKLLDFHAESHDFHPLGIDYHAPSKKLFVINLAKSGPRIEVFRLLAGDRAATHIATLQDPRIRAPNNIAAISEDELIVTNDHFFPASQNLILSMLETYLAVPISSVVHVTLSGKGTAMGKTETLTRLSFANGVVSLNATILAVSAASQPAVELFEMSRPAHGSLKLTRKKSIRTPFLPDNLSVDGNGKLLVAGHPFPPALEKIAANQQFCHGAEAALDDKCTFDRMSSVAEWSEADGLKLIYAGEGYGTATTAVRDVKTGVGYLVGLYEPGFLRWKE